MVGTGIWCTVGIDCKRVSEDRVVFLARDQANVIDWKTKNVYEERV